MREVIDGAVVRAKAVRSTCAVLPSTASLLSIHAETAGIPRNKALPAVSQTWLRLAEEADVIVPHERPAAGCIACDFTGGMQLAERRLDLGLKYEMIGAGCPANLALKELGVTSCLRCVLWK